MTSCTNYSTSKDTILSCDNGSIQIIKSIEGNNEILKLYDYKEKNTIETNVMNYLLQKNVLYITGEHGFTKVNINEHTYQQNNEMTVFDDKDIKAFKSILKGSA